MKWAFVGASTIASQHMIAAVRAQKDSDVSWVVSGSEQRVRTYADEHQIENATTDLTHALADPSVTAVYISSTNEKHLSQAMAAIEAGKHILCEKPLAMSVSDAVQMVKAAEAKGLVFGTNHHLRCSGTHHAIRNLIQDGTLGRVLSLRIHHAVYLPGHLQGWRINDAKAGGGVIPDITVHDADVTRFLLAEDPVSVIGEMSSSSMGEGVEDSAMSVWTMPSGTMVMSHESFTHSHAGTGLEVHGDKGSIFAKGVMTQLPVGTIELHNADGCHTVPYSDHSLYGYGVAKFTAAVAGTDQPAASGIDGVKSLAVAKAVKQAAETGQRVTIDYGL